MDPRACTRHRRSQAAFLTEVRLPQLIHLKETLRRKALSHRLGGGPCPGLHQSIPATAGGSSILFPPPSPSPPEVSNSLPLRWQGGRSRLKSLHNFTGLFPGPEVGSADTWGLKGKLIFFCCQVCKTVSSLIHCLASRKSLKTQRSLSFPGGRSEDMHQLLCTEGSSREDFQNPGFWSSPPESDSVGLAWPQERAFHGDPWVI